MVMAERPGRLTVLGFGERDRAQTPTKFGGKALEMDKSGQLIM